MSKTARMVMKIIGASLAVRRLCLPADWRLARSERRAAAA